MNQKSNKQKFSSLGFIMSSIGAAVGLGNIWRFPKEMVASGGSSFILIYLIILCLIAFPIVLLEMQYGLFFKKSVVTCFKNVNKKVGNFIGWKQVWVNLFACVYYVVIISWFIVGFVHSLIPSLFEKWGTNSNYFEENILQLPSNGKAVGFSYLTLIGIIVLLILIFIVISLGVKKGLEKTNLFLVPSLFFLLIGLTIYSLTRKNALIGIEKLFKFKSESFTRPFIWYKATIQAMFSTGIMLGSFIVLTKNSDIKTDKGNDALMIVASDSFVGIISGILITATISSSYSGTSNEVKKQLNEFFNSPESGGSALIFKELPKIFYNMEGQKILGQILFIFFIIGFLFATFSSIIVLIEIFVDSMVEKFPNIGRKKILLFWSVFAFLQSIVFLFFHQVKVTDEQDLWINHFVLLVGFFELIILVCYKNFDKIIKSNERYTYLKMSKFKWLKRLLIFITLPIVFLLVLFGFIELFNIDVIYFKNTPIWFQNIFGLQDKININSEKVNKIWTSPERLFTIGTIIFMIIIPLFLSIITNKKESKTELNLKNDRRN